ncbi:RNA cytosine-C(5)-methyltransferase NSUN2-like [Asterias amurensis]|uniref:RNA cytosine-C(5)-methyltransferase NSUN2-like n=1 Tax=Asterias amurensis TaxID=7602 RepID=UPI003AB3D707
MGKQHARKKKGNKSWGAKKANAASGGGGDAGEDKQNDWRGANNYQAIERKNEAFEAYYKEQNIVPEEEWDNFMSTLKEELPVTFRITGYRSHAQQMLTYLKGHYIGEMMEQTVEEGDTLVQPTSMPWYPEELAWTLNLTRKNIRKSPACKKLHNFLITETESGNISRQEAVSMIPPLLLDVKPHHKVLDMCAAPGSKTAQLIELLHADQVYGWPEGFVVANDADNKRCYIMVHQAKRLNSPCCMIVNHDASVFPTIRAAQGQDPKPKPVVYDRILCDVPCSGDGTLRKNFLIWKKWTPNSGQNLHIVQYRILQRGAELLEVGGRMVYSTCSFNPIENEAVVASVLQKCEGSLELVDVSDHLPGLKRIPGLTKWKVIDNVSEVFGSYEDVPESKKQKFKATMWPPTEEEADRLNLHRCVRILPHQQNTGGFFVAVLRKVATLPWMKQTTPPEGTAEAKVEPEVPAAGEALKAEPEDSPCTVKTEDGEPEIATVVKTEASEDMETTVQSEPSDGTEPSNVKKEDGETAVEPEIAMEASNGKETTVKPEPEDGACDADVKMETNEDDALGTSETAEDDEGSSDPLTEEALASGPTEEELAPSTDGPPPPPPQKKKFQGYKEDPFVFFKEDEAIWEQIKSFYSVDDSFPVTLLLTRCHGGKKRNLYMVNKSIKSILENNEDKIKVVNGGVKVWSRSDAKEVACDFRLAQEGIYSVFSFLNDRKIPNITKEDIQILLTQENPYCSKLGDNAREALAEKGQGSLVFVYDPKESDPESTDISFVLVGWRGKHSVRSYIPKGERQHILRMCNIDIPTDSVDPPSTPNSDTPQDSSEAKDATPSETPGDTEGDKQGDKPAANGGQPDPPGVSKGDTSWVTPVLDKPSAAVKSPVKSPARDGRDTESQSPRRDRHRDRDSGRKRQRESRFSSSDRGDEAQRKRDFYFYYY